MTSKETDNLKREMEETLLEFPCEFPVKIMGRNEDNFEEAVTALVLAHAKLFHDKPVTTNPSSSGKFLSVTVTIEAQSKAQLDLIYQDLTGCEQVLVAL
jgi:putative lipoic acid-binding regulatory protein